MFNIASGGGKRLDTGIRGSKITIYFFVFIKFCYIFVGYIKQGYYVTQEDYQFKKTFRVL